MAARAVDGAAATFLAVAAAALDFGMRRRTAAVIAALVALNPVVVCQLASYLVDGLLISFLACYVAAVLRCFGGRASWSTAGRPDIRGPMHQYQITGLVYLCFFCAAGGVYLLIRQRRLLPRYAAVQLASIALGVGVLASIPT